MAPSSVVTNGSVPADQLVAVQGVQLAYNTAAAYAAMRAACLKATGVSLVIAKPAGGYRSLAMQRDMKRNPAAYNIAPGMVPFIAPAGKSTHGFGRALDLTTATRTAASAWLLEHCDEYGFAKPPPGDRNHFMHNGTAPAGGTTTPIPATGKVKNMSTIYYKTSNDKPAGEGGTIVLFALAGESPGTSANWLETASTDVKAGWSSGHGAGVHLTAASFASFKARHLEPLNVGPLGEVTTDGSPIDLAQAKLIGEQVALALLNGLAGRLTS